MKRGEIVMKFYKIRHSPTGLFYKPSKHGYKENLAKRGKIYHEERYAKSALTYINDCGYYSLEDVEEARKLYQRIPVTDAEEGEFEIIEYEVTENE